MYAIIRTGGKQYKVQAGDLLRVEKLDKGLGEEFQLTDIIALSANGEVVFGEPTIQNAAVTVVVTRQAKAPKVIVFKKKRRQGYRKMQGHRQLFTELFVKTISGPVGTTQAEKQAPVREAQSAKSDSLSSSDVIEKKISKKTEKLLSEGAALKKTKKESSPAKAVQKTATKKATAVTKKKTTTKKAVSAAKKTSSKKVKSES